MWEGQSHLGTAVKQLILKNEVYRSIQNFSGANPLLVQAVKYKRKDVLIERIDMPEEK